MARAMYRDKKAEFDSEWHVLTEGTVTECLKAIFVSKEEDYLCFQEAHFEYEICIKV